MAELSPAALGKARRDFEVYNALNSASFVVLSGSFLTLYALRLGATNFLLGLLNSLVYASFFLMPLGKRLVRHRPIVAVFGWGWFFRYAAMLPVLASPFLAAAGLRGPAFGLLLAGAAGFNVARGIGIIGNNPVLARLAEGSSGGRDRGSFLAGVQVTSSVAGLAASLAIALVLRLDAGMSVYAASIAAGIVLGFVGVAFLFRMPEPEEYRPAPGSGLLRVTRDAFREKPYRAFMAVYVLLAFTASMGRSFLPVWAKEAYGQGDDLVMLYSFAASLGAVAMGLLSRLVVDRLGAKPLYVIYTGLALAGLAPAIVSPALGGGALVASLLGGVFFLSSFGFSGEETAGQAYHFSLVPRERTLDLAVAYFIAHGLGGTAGSFAGGLLLDGLRAAGLEPLAAFRAFYGVTGLLLVLALLRMRKLVPLGSSSVRESLGALFSMRDLRAFDLLSRLDRSADPDEEVRLIHEIGASGSGKGEAELLGYLASPRFEVRMEALLALEALGALREETLRALDAEVERHPFTTSYLAARILGKRGGPASLPALRRAALAEDYMLRGAALVALARLGDRSFAPEIEAALVEAGNPRVKLSAAYALELLGRRESIPALVSCLRREDPPAYVSDELLLAMARILGLMGRFYPLYAAFMDDERRGRAALADAAAERAARPAPAGSWAAGGGSAPGSFSLEGYAAAMESLFAEPPDGVPMARFVLGVGLDPGVELVLSEAALDPTLGYRGFRFFIAAYVVLAA